MAKITYDSALQELTAAKSTTKCDDLIKHLRSLGYEVNKTKSGNHYTFTHAGLGYYGGNFDCGHGRNPAVLPAYIGKIIKILAKHNEEQKEIESQKGA